MHMKSYFNYRMTGQWYSPNHLQYILKFSYISDKICQITGTHSAMVGEFIHLHITWEISFIYTSTLMKYITIKHITICFNIVMILGMHNICLQGYYIVFRITIQLFSLAYDILDRESQRVKGEAPKLYCFKVIAKCVRIIKALLEL